MSKSKSLVNPVRVAIDVLSFKIEVGSTALRQKRSESMSTDVIASHFL
jgi:hypothetical protein